MTRKLFLSTQYIEDLNVLSILEAHLSAFPCFSLMPVMVVPTSFSFEVTVSETPLSSTAN